MVLPLELLPPPAKLTRLPANDDTSRPALGPISRSHSYSEESDVILFEGACEDLLASIPSNSIQLVVTSPPYNLGKVYERKQPLQSYLEGQERVIREVIRVLKPGGSVCWQVGNHIDHSEVIPLDTVLYPIFKAYPDIRLRNRIVWHYEHGLHASRRFSGRYETILWFTKGDDYFFNLDPVRVPQKYPNKKHYQGPKVGQLSGNPLGKSPGDVWIFPNVKSNHVEKTIHPCQFPVELVERLVLALSKPRDMILDPFGGVGTTVVAAILNQRRGMMAEVVPEYVEIAKERIRAAEAGTLRTRPADRAVYEPPK